ncbi:tRNA (adenine(22)-N(1))-methyltransferase [Paenactinomyces guangxiensis]|uniref:SAM-dependent methyltransferase n=1 Tax=Paenactinomyces guangxiensis TaxID=1490290 RepID=A0A7W1WNJ2_9BACL|nr:class I SAM-dependent methyltransferase [Paenactinomyces guangxiensis]MBA4493178.1 SAM-dependent methyltransferase [Paenactinomyces guangxiensis]MBH8589972.1 SAM-dependent methyltransferase [Paenactinomyces guangxiensis]
MKREFLNDDWQISYRLQTIADFIPDQMRVADIGGDHAFLLLHLAKQGRLRRGIVGEINPGPFENAQHRVSMMGYSPLIEVRLGDGLSVVDQDEIDVVVIAGMGGALISQILEEGKEKLSHIKRLVLQPNVGGRRVRTWLNENHFQIIEETIVEEAGIFYEVIAAEPGEGQHLYRHPKLTAGQLLELGPILWRKKHPLLKKKLLEDWRAKQKILRQLENGRSEEARRRKEELEQEMKEWEKVMTWLSAEQN